jgi:Lrp/AsnC family transcriptional regulator for asnA, asnC and gidA
MILRKSQEGKMDKLDLSILASLQTDGRRPFTDIAHELGVSEGTVRNRVSKLVEKKVLHIVGLVDPSSLGFNAPAIIGVSVNEGDIEQIAAGIATYPEVSYLILVSGEFDLFVEVLCKSREHLANFINHKLRKVKGVERTQTFMTLQTFKMAYGAPPITQEQPKSED